MGGRGRDACHIGGGDQIAGLTYLQESGQLCRGDQVLVVGVGFGWTTALVTVDEVPDWFGPDASSLRVLDAA
ncbi:hypothetical protein [Streptomyces sp. NPDC085529]|uniref:hypothetical protein n=1 Tax=Streptomyces sp. NPDC085529 TaxID=3365729 RepID=UPI0037D06B6D